MRFGFIIPGGDLHTIIQLGREAEDAGWDGIFYWDGIYLSPTSEVFDPWVTLAAIASHTQRIRLGAIITPLARRRPWKVARETVTLDHLSRGRLVLPVGLGTLDDGGFTRVGEPTDRSTRAHLLDESLEIITGLWSGQPFSYSGKHYHLDEMTFLPRPVQSPRIPIWVVGAWPHAKSMRRALRYDGLLPEKHTGQGPFEEIQPQDIMDIARYAATNRSDPARYDIIMQGETPGDEPARAASITRAYAEAGATWWLESMWTNSGGSDAVRRRIRQGPPRE